METDKTDKQHHDHLHDLSEPNHPEKLDQRPEQKTKTSSEVWILIMHLLNRRNLRGGTARSVLCNQLHAASLLVHMQHSQGVQARCALQTHSERVHVFAQVRIAHVQHGVNDSCVVGGLNALGCRVERVLEPICSRTFTLLHLLWPQLKICQQDVLFVVIEVCEHFVLLSVLAEIESQAIEMVVLGLHQREQIVKFAVCHQETADLSRVSQRVVFEEIGKECLVIVKIEIQAIRLQSLFCLVD